MLYSFSQLPPSGKFNAIQDIADELGLSAEDAEAYILECMPSALFTADGLLIL